MRQIVLDTETTGLSPESGHRIIELGCVEILSRKITDKTFHYYLQPDREIDRGAMAVHGITNEFLADKPRFNEIVIELLDFIQDAELIIHNAPFDVGFLNAELSKINRRKTIEERCSILDTLVLARKKHPGQKNSLDALCKRYGVSNAKRELHGALLDAQILAEVYLAMTGGQTALPIVNNHAQVKHKLDDTNDKSYSLKIINANEDELSAHHAFLKKIAESSGVDPLFLASEEPLQDS